MLSLLQLNSLAVTVVQKDIQDALIKELNELFPNEVRVKSLRSAFQQASSLASILSSIPESGGVKC